MVEGAFYRRRRSIRLPHYDYAQRGVYFITLCVQHRRSLFGDVIDGSMVLKYLGSLQLNGDVPRRSDRISWSMNSW
jgi:hypothetical protein